MAALYIVLGILALLLCLALFTKMTLAVKARKKNGEELETEISLSVFGGRVDLSPLMKKSSGGKDKKEKNENNKENDGEKKPISGRLKTVVNGIKRGKYTYLLSKKSIKKKIKLECLDFSLVFGLDDAAHTGIATGAAWGSVYNIFSFVDRLFTIKGHSFKITPVFDGEYLDMDFETKIRFSISNIVSLASVIFINYIKSEKYTSEERKI